MTDKEKTDLKDRISEILKSRISANGQADRNELKDLFKADLKTLTELIEELKSGQIINVYPSGHTFAAGLKFKSFTTYRQFIEEVNFPKPTIVEYKTPWYDKALRFLVAVLSAILIWYNILDKMNEQKIDELTDTTNRQKATIDTITKESRNLNVLLEKERARLKILVVDSLNNVNKGVKK